MSATSVVPSPLDSAEILHQHLELSHYVDTYRQSTERVRWVIFVLMVLSVVVLVAQWNTAPRSWALHRLSKLEEMSRAVKDIESVSDADAKIAKISKGRFNSRAELVGMLDGYRGAFVERVVLFEIPGIGVTFDVNDLGLFSGIAFSLLLALLVFALMREYENLYLALFKVRRLHDSDHQLPSGESSANYLYHALAMSQVFSAPPTLAVWKPSLLKRLVPSVVFLIPAAIQLYIIWTNYSSLSVAHAYGLSSDIMIPQYGLLGLVGILGAVAIVYAKGSNHRWESAFLHINPSYRRVGRVPWTMWVRVPHAKSFGDHLQRRLASQMIQRLRVTRYRANESITVRDSMLIDGDTITHHDVRRMSVALRARAESTAKDKWGAVEILRANVLESVLHDRRWRVKVKFDVRRETSAESVEEEPDE